MSQAIDDLIGRIKELEEELEVEFKKKREEFEFTIVRKWVRFAEEVARRFNVPVYLFAESARLPVRKNIDNIRLSTPVAKPIVNLSPSSSVPE